MPSGNLLKAAGMVVEILQQGAYRIQLANGHTCIGRRSVRGQAISTPFALGDQVALEFNPYDLSRARIVAAVSNGHASKMKTTS